MASAERFEVCNEIERRRQFHIRAQAQELARRYVGLKVDILNRVLPEKILLHPDGHCETMYPQWVTEELAKIDAALQSELEWLEEIAYGKR